MEYLFIQFINLQVIPPDSYFHQMPKLETLAIGIDLNNDCFDGWTALKPSIPMAAQLQTSLTAFLISKEYT